MKLGPTERRVARRIRAYMKKHGRTPKKWEVMWRDRRDPLPTVIRTGERRGSYRFYTGLTSRRAFNALVKRGYVIHSRNGHCWLTRAGKGLIR